MRYSRPTLLKVRLMSVKALVIAGSPRKGGNSDIMAEHLVRGLEEGGAAVTVLHARDLKVGHCLGCNACSRTGECVRRDDMQSLYGLLTHSHRVCLVTPIFFCLVPSITQAIIERCQTLWAHKYPLQRSLPELELPRQGLVAAVGGTHGKRMFDALRCTAHYWFDTLDVAHPHLLTYGGIDEKGAIREHPEVLEEVRQAGLRLATPEGWPPEA